MLKWPTQLRLYLQGRPQWLTVVFAALVTFSVYTCMYGFRKAFTAAGFANSSFAGIDLKVWLVTAQVIGYMFSKFYGIKFIAEHAGDKKGSIILWLIAASWLALLGFAVVPAPWSILFMLLNGFPLGMIWGLVFSFVEGRRTTELMGAVLASSFIFASGFAKSLGTWLIKDVGVDEVWMPFCAGALYFLPLMLFTWLLHAIPPPTPADLQSRCERKSMDSVQRKKFIGAFWPGLLLLIISYILLTILRDFRDNFAPEILKELNLSGQASVFTQTETLVALFVLTAVGLVMLVQQNFKAFMLNHIIILAGWLIAAVATLLFSYNLLAPMPWFVCVGTGLYMGYIPINTLYFERMIASFRLTANVGFVMYLADAFGYLGSVLVLFVKQFSGIQLSWTQFFIQAILAGAGISTVLLILCMMYYKNMYSKFLK